MGVTCLVRSRFRSRESGVQVTKLRHTHDDMIVKSLAPWLTLVNCPQKRNKNSWKKGGQADPFLCFVVDPRPHRLDRVDQVSKFCSDAQVTAYPRSSAAVTSEAAAWVKKRLVGSVESTGNKHTAAVKCSLFLKSSLQDFSSLQKNTNKSSV